MQALWRQFFRERRGNVTMVVALCAVPLIAVTTGVVEMQGMENAKSRLQAAVDAGALAGAQRLGLVNANGSADVQSAATTAANSDLGTFGDLPVSYTVTVDTTKNSVTLVGTAEHKALIGFMGFGSGTIKATATADALGSVPLCILQSGMESNNQGIQVRDHAMIHANGCSVQANRDISVDPSASIQAGAVTAAGMVSGPVSPAGQSGGLAVADPFAAMQLNPPLDCLTKILQIKVLTYITLPLLPGIHCEQYDVETGATLLLLPGEHYFMNNLSASNNSVIEGDDVTLIFGSNQAAHFSDQATVKLTARKTGPFAGFLIATTRDNTQHFSINSSNVSELLGTIYIPSAELDINTTGNVAQDSAWSIIVADSIKMNNNPNLVINSNYVGSGVPVPTGVGPSKKVTLVQ